MDNGTSEQGVGQVARVTARVYRGSTRIGTVELIAGLSAKQLRGYRDAARYGAVRIRGNVVIDAQYR